MKQKDLEDLKSGKNFQPGAGRDPKNNRYWSSVATSHSEIAPRASDGEMKLHDTGSMEVRPTTMKGHEPRKVNAAMRGEDPAEKNHVGSGSYMPNVRRKV